MNEILELLPLLIPLILVQYGLAIYCIIDIAKHGVKNLSVPAWVLICLFINIIGPVVYLLVGRKGYENHD